MNLKSLFLWTAIIVVSCTQPSYDNPNDPENINYTAPALTVSKGVSKSIIVQWSAKQAGVIEYIVYRGNRPDTLSELKRLPGTTLIYEDNDPALLPGRTYYYAVKALLAPDQLSSRSAAAGGYIAFDPDTIIVSPTGDKTDEIPHRLFIDPLGNIFTIGHLQYDLNRLDIIIRKYTPYGLPDSSFGRQGVVLFKSPIAQCSRAEGYGITMDRAGKLLITGAVGNGKQDYYMVTGRFNPDGSLDAGFNGTGYIYTNTSGREAGKDIRVTHEGKIVVAGLKKIKEGGSSLALWQFNQDGSPDTAFGPGGTGYTFINKAGGVIVRDQPYQLQIDSRNNLLVAGVRLNGDNGPNDAVIWRFTPRGLPDTGFNRTGYKVFGFFGNKGKTPLHEMVRGVASDSEGNIIVSGFTRRKWENGLGRKVIFVCRFTGEGVLDSSYSNRRGCFLFYTRENKSGEIFNMMLDKKNAVYCAGYLDEAVGNADALVFKLTPGGTLDTSFYGCGYTTGHNFAGGDGHDRVSGIGLTKEGTIIGTGFSSNGTDEDLFLIKYNN